jgi:hypothetical protein
LKRSAHQSETLDFGGMVKRNVVTKIDKLKYKNNSNEIHQKLGPIRLREI